MNTIEITDYGYVKKPINKPTYSNNNQFEQPSDGFGLSNYRKTSHSNANIKVPSHSEIENQIINMQDNRHNGLLFRDKYQDYQISETNILETNKIYQDIISKTIANNNLSRVFFSEKNVNHLISLICKLIKIYSNGSYNISEKSQNVTELLIVMRSMYLQIPVDYYSSDVKTELCKLNRATIDWLVPRMIVNIQQYLGYMRDQSSSLYTIPRFQNVNITGTKTNKFISSIYI